MVTISSHNYLVEQSFNLVMNNVRSMPLNYSIVETPYSIYLTFRKSLVKSSIGDASSEIPADKLKKLEESNQTLRADLEAALN